MDTITKTETVVSDLSQMAEASTIVLRQKVEKLSVNEQTMEIARSLCEQKKFKFKGIDAADLLRKEWLNDVLCDEPKVYESSSQNPDKHFLSWLELRLKSPYHVSFRAVDKAFRLYGPEISMAFSQLRWHQELAWARKFRIDPSKKVSAYSSLFLAEAKRNPVKTFLSLLEIYVVRSIENEYASHRVHSMSVSDIEDSFISSKEWKPLYVTYSETAYAKLLNNLSAEQLTLVSKKARDEYEDERIQKLIDHQIEYLKLYPLQYRLTVIYQAKMFNMNSNEVIVATRRFIEDLRTRSFKFESDRRIDDMFFDWLKSAVFNAEEACVVPGESDWIKFRSIGTEWFNRLPDDCQKLGGLQRNKFFEWRKEIETGKRNFPIDMVSDYLFFLFEEQSK